jgi:hypothetical protein
MAFGLPQTAPATREKADAVHCASQYGHAPSAQKEKTPLQYIFYAETGYRTKSHRLEMS